MRDLWLVDEAHLEAAQDDATLLAIRDQERAGLDIVTDGEQRRESYSNRFATALDGVDIDKPGVALDRSGHPNPVPRVAGAIRRKHPVEVDDVKFLRANTTRPIKITVPGPFTMSQQAQNDFYKSEEECAFAYAAAHISLYIFDQMFDLAKVASEIVLRLYLTIGFTALVGLAALAATMLTEQTEIFFASLGLGAFAFLATTIVVTVHAFWRVRDPIVRAQTAWLSLGLLVGIGIWPLLFVAGDYLPDFDANSDLAWVEIALQVITSAIFVLCLGIAITRYHLFDIAVVVNRALVYTLLTSTLAVIYFGGRMTMRSGGGGWSPSSSAGAATSISSVCVEVATNR